MAIEDAARAALLVFPQRTVQTHEGALPLALVMVAVAGAESSWVPDAAGDRGLPGPDCAGYTSWGLWQIHSVHDDILTAASGSRDPCAWAAWLADPVHCAEAALAVLGDGLRLRAWTTWRTGMWASYLPQARAAVAAALADGATGPPA